MNTITARKAFTLIEILLVVMIIGMAASVAVPVFVNSFKGAKLRTSARSVVIVNRYARSMAILQQKRVALRYDFARNRMDLSLVEGHPNVGQMRSQIDSSSFFGDRSYGDEGLAGNESDDEKKSAPGGAMDTSRKLREGVRFADFVGVSSQEFDEGSWVNYYPNGMCDEHSFRLIDDRGKEALVSIEPITGEISMELHK